HRAASEIAYGQRIKNRRDQSRPGGNAAAEIRIEVTRAEHLETHQHGAHNKDDDKNGDSSHGCADGDGHCRLCFSIAFKASAGAKSSVKIFALGSIAGPPPSRRRASATRLG